MKRKRSAHEDPMSHRIIEKRRRDRMNNCLADLSRLIPSSYLKKGRGRIEMIDGGMIMECDPQQVVSRVALRADDIPLGEQTVAQVLQSAKEQLKWSLLK